jgi:hypothetical protein
VAASYAVTGFGLASLLGMPGQSLQIALSFWTLAFWILLPADAVADERGRRGWNLPAALTLALILGVTTFVGGMGHMRPPFRAARFDQGYRYGVHGRFEGAAGTTRTTAHAVDVPQALTKWVKLTIWVDHPDANERPVELRVWRDHERLVAGRFPRAVPMTRYVSVPGGNRRFVFESTVDRTFRPEGTRGPEVGLTMSWEFVNEPPAAGRANP